jgi:hypothetical protein
MVSTALQKIEIRTNHLPKIELQVNYTIPFSHLFVVTLDTSKFDKLNAVFIV